MRTASTRESVATPKSGAVALDEGRDAMRRGSDDEPGRGVVVGVRARVLISFLVLLAVATATSLFVLRSVLLSRIGSEVQSSLTTQVDSLRGIASSQKNPATGKEIRGLPQTFDAFLASERPLNDGVLVALIGDKVYRATPEQGAPAGLLEGVKGIGPNDQPGSGEINTAAGPVRYVSVPISSGKKKGTLIAAQDYSNQRSQVASAIRIAIGVGIVVMLLASLFIWLAASRAMAPLHALARTTKKITETDLSDRVSVRGSDELAELGRTFNGMLDRLEIAFADQKEFLADVGHELRTPITVIRGHLETLGDDPEEREEAQTVIDGELGRMTRLVDDLLMLARSGRPDFLRPEPLDLDLLTHDLFVKVQALGERRWVLEQVGLGIVQADQHRLASAFMNLAQNAVKHTTPGEEIAVGSALDATKHEARLWVRDTGPGIKPAEQERIFERFAHAEDIPGGGAGLGLSIVKAIAESHGGRVTVESRPGWGATFTLIIPLTPPTPPPTPPKWPES